MSRASSLTGPGRHRSHRASAGPPTGPTGSAARPFDVVAEGLVYVLLAFAPLAYGTTQSWSREVFLLLVSAAATVAAAKHVAIAWDPARFGDGTGRPVGFVWSWAYVPIALFLALAAAQAVSVPAAWVAAVSPGTTRLRAELLADLPDAAAALRRASVSFYPYATRSQAVMVAAVGVLYAVVLDVFRRSAAIRRLLAVVAAIGGVVAALAVSQNVTGTTMIYGVVAQTQRNSGPFQSYSHFSQFMNLSVAAGLALLLDRVARLADFYRTPAEVWEALRRPREWAVWALAALCVAGPVTVMLSMSRMGLISLVVAAAASGGVLAWRGRPADGSRGSGRAWVLVGLGMVVFLVLLCVGFDTVYSRLSSVRDPNTTGRRQEMLKDMVAEFRQFPLLGTGLGTHEFVFGLYDHRDLPSIATHAENEYAELMEETGIVGVALGAAFLAVVASDYARATRRPAEPIGFVPFGLGFGLVAILVHSGTDFGQHLPANAALTATFAALLATLARRRRDREGGAVAPPAARPVRRAAAVAGGLGVLTAAAAAGVAVGLWADRARQAESVWNLALDRAAALSRAAWQGSDQAYIDLLTPAAAAVALEPGDVEYRYWTDADRWHSLARSVDPTVGGAGLPEEARPWAEQLVADFDAARLLCPTYGPPLCVEGQVNRFVLGRAALGERQIRAAYRLSPYDRTVCLIAGAEAASAGQAEVATDALTKYATLGGGVQDYADVCVRAKLPIIPYRIVHHDRRQLLYLASRMPPSDPGWQPWITKCTSVAGLLLADAASKPDAPPDVLAEQAAADRQVGRLADAAALYGRALTQNYGELSWRLARGRCLLDLDRPDAASEDARIVLRLRPENADAKSLLAACDARLGTGPSSAP